MFPIPGATKTGGTLAAPQMYLWPYNIDANLIDSHMRYLSRKSVKLAPSTVTQADLEVPANAYPKWTDLPEIFKATDLVKAVGDNPSYATQGPKVSMNSVYGGYYTYSTGYNYFGHMTDKRMLYMTNQVNLYPEPYDAAKDYVQHPEDIGTPQKRGALWTDSLWYYNGTGSNWVAVHTKKQSAGEVSSPNDIRGQHVGFSDGSVVFTRIAGPAVLSHTDAAIRDNCTFRYKTTAYFFTRFDR